MKHLLVAILFFFTCIAYSQQYSFITYANSLGLPQSQIQCITQDQQGYIWVGTLGGLAKFNGKTFSTIPLELGLFNNRISALNFIYNEIWVGHEGGITKISGQTIQSFPLLEKDALVTVTDFVGYKQKTIAATEGGGLYIIDNNKLSKISLPNEDASVCRVMEVINGILYIGTRDGLYQSTDLINFKSVKTFDDVSISGIAQLADKVYISTYYAGLYESDVNFTRRQSITVESDDLYIISLAKDKRNQLWLSMPEGAIQLSSKHKQLTLNDANGFPASGVTCTFEDKEGNIWFGSDGKGLIRFANQSVELFTKNTGLPSELILGGIKLSNKQYVFGTYNSGAFSMNNSGECKVLPIQASTVWSIKEYENRLWFATNEGLISWNYSNPPTTFHFDEFNNTFRVLKLVGNRLITASEQQIGYIQNNELHAFKNLRFNSAKDGNIRDITEYNSRLIVATSTGVFELNINNQQKKLLQKFKSNVTSVAVDVNNKLWIGTENGLFQYDGIQFSPLKYSNKSGANFINFIHRSKNKQILGTNDGVYIFDCSDEKPVLVKHIGTTNGLINLESNINSAFLENDMLWFGTTDGLARMKINHNDEQTHYKPQLNIRSILLNFAEYNFVDHSKTIKVTHTNNHLTIELDGIDMQDPESVLYQYRLIGASEKWSPPSAISTVVLSNLDDGSYTLQMRAVSGVNRYSDILEIPLVVKPPFWRTWWFYLICFVVIAIATRYYFLLRIKAERDKNYKENLENKSRLLSLEQQTLNASMNRHFIFNALNSIQYFINTQDKLSANRYLTNFAKLIRQNLDNANESDNMVSLQEEIERLELYLSLEAMRFKDKFTYSINCEDIDTEQVMVPAMLLQPFVENSIIHGILPNHDKKGEILVAIKVIAGQLEICIDDNGVGIEKSLNEKLQTKGDHKSQGMEITSKRIDLIRKIWKQDYELIGPFQMMNPDRSIKGTRVLIKIPYENLENQY
jgi:ligand-binding sensor domain-containing protein/anti-sigma regulatory factor (Ser/Thr protein kinase)